MRTQGSSWRCRASSSLRRVSVFSASSSSRRAACHSSRVPVLWLVIGCLPFLVFLSSCLSWQRGPARAAMTSHHRWREPGYRGGREDDPDAKPGDGQRERHIDGGFGGQQLLRES